MIPYRNYSQKLEYQTSYRLSQSVTTETMLKRTIFKHILLLCISLCLSHDAALADKKGYNSFDDPRIIKELAHHVRKKRLKALNDAFEKIPKTSGYERNRKMWMAAYSSSSRRFEESIAMFDNVSSLETAPPQVLGYAASAYGQCQEFPKAIKLATLALKSGPNVEAFAARAACYAELSQWEKAAADYEGLAQARPSSARQDLIKASRCYMKMGKDDLALAATVKASTAPGGNADPAVFLAMGACQQHLNRWKESLESLNTAVNLAKARELPQQSEGNMLMSMSLNERAKVYEKMGKKVLAQADRKEAEKFSRGVAEDIIGH